MTHIYGQGIETTSQPHSSVEQDTTKNILPESSDVAIATDETEMERGVVSDNISKHSGNNDIDQCDVAMETTANVVAMETKSNGRGIINDQSHIDSKRRNKRKRNLEDLEQQEENTRSKKKSIKEKRRETDLDQLTVDALHDKHKSKSLLVLIINHT